jgi:hypothetical protein
MENRTSATADGDKRRRLRASLWHAEDEDGGDAFYDEAFVAKAQKCRVTNSPPEDEASLNRRLA